MPPLTSWQTVCGGDASHTWAPHPQSMSSAAPQSVGFGSHTKNGPFCSLFTHTSSSSAQNEQSGTQSHASAGTHCPVQQPASASTDATSPGPQSGARSSQTTSTG